MCATVTTAGKLLAIEAYRERKCSSSGVQDGVEDVSKVLTKVCLACQSGVRTRRARVRASEVAAAGNCEVGYVSAAASKISGSCCQSNTEAGRIGKRRGRGKAANDGAKVGRRRAKDRADTL